jgi:hypothetical protein
MRARGQERGGWRGERAARGEAGSALIIALLVVLALTGLGIVGLRHTTTEMRQSSNLRYSRQAYYTSEAGMMAAIQRVGSNGEAFWRFMKRRAQAERSRNINPNAVPSFQFTSSEFKPLGGLFGESGKGFEGQQGTNAQFTVTFGEPADTSLRPPGVGQQFCYKRFTFRSTGVVGTPPSNAELRINEPVQASSAQHVAHALVGPMLCDEGYSN